MTRKEEDIMLLVLVVGAVAFLRRRVTWGTGWVWPVPTLRTKDGAVYQAVISDGVGTPRGDDVHRGVDIMYKRRNAADRPEYPKGPAGGGTPGFFAPPLTPVVAAKDGTIWSSAKTARGGTVVIDHGKPFATYYTHLAQLAFPEHQDGRRVNTADATEPGPVTRVKAGDIIGFMGADPMDASKTRHLHFAVWHGGTDEHAVDPAPEMTHWPRPAWVWTPNR